MNYCPPGIIEQIRRHARHTRLPQAELARVAGVGTSAISRFLAGRSVLKERPLSLLAAFLALDAKKTDPCAARAALRPAHVNVRPHATVARHAKQPKRHKARRYRSNADVTAAVHVAQRSLRAANRRSRAETAATAAPSPLPNKHRTTEKA